MNKLYIIYINFLTNNSVDLWLTIISIIIAIIAIIISTYYAAKSSHQIQKENFQKKKEMIFNVFNDFLLFLETIVNAKSYGIESFNPKDLDIDFYCLEVIGKVHCFSQINSLKKYSQNKLNVFLKKIHDLSNDIQTVRKKKKNKNLDEMNNKIKKLRSEILKEINNPNFFNRKNKISRNNSYE